MGLEYINKYNVTQEEFDKKGEQYYLDTIINDALYTLKGYK